MSDIEDIYRLSPMQEGMLFQSLHAEHSDVYFQQLRMTLEGTLDAEAFLHAWEDLVNRHGALRASFHWQESARPVQVIHAKVDLPWAVLDWRGVTVDERAKRVSTLLADDRAMGARLDRAPLMRCTLIRLSDQHHWLVWSHHHLLSDGWCRGLLFRDLFHFYRNRTGGSEPSLSPPPRYRQFIEWIERQDAGAESDFWKRRLQGFDAPVELVLDEKGDASRVAAEKRFALPAPLWRRVNGFTRSHRITLNTIVQGAWALLLSRYARRDDVVFGATVSGRPADLARSDDMVGLFINTLPVRATLASERTVLPWLRELQAALIESMSFAQSRLVDIHGWSEVPRSQRLFESIVIFENYPTALVPDEPAPGLRLTEVRSDEGAPYPLALVIVPEQSGPPSFRLVYESDRFSDDSISRLAGHLLNAIDAVAGPAESRIGELSFLSRAARRHALRRAGGAESNRGDTHSTVIDLFEAEVRAGPEAPALEFENQVITYAALDARSNRLARLLRDRSVVPGDRVALHAEPSFGLIAGVLGIWKAGAVYVPIDPALPPKRVAAILADSDASALVTEHALHEPVEVHPSNVIWLDVAKTQIARGGSAIPSEPVRAVEIAYLMYTSGSTGKPNGVAVAHRGLCNTARAQIPDFGVEPDSRVLQFSSIGFDASISEIAMALCSGATLCLASREARLPGPSLAKLLRDLEITHVTLPPSVLATLPREELPDLTHLVVAGEVCPPGLAHQWSQGRRFFNAYGPTECAVCATVFEVKERRSPVPIGRPIAGARVYLLDHHGQLTDEGIPGEIWIGGSGVASGYHARPALTRERFRPDRFLPDQGGLMFRTGDLGRWLPDGNLEFLGRVDRQLKIRGVRIEPGEVEAQLLEHPEVAACAVVYRREADGNPVLVAYLVARSDSKLSSSEVRAFLGERLPAGMVPSRVDFLEQLPLTANGKLDREALSDREWIGRKERPSPSPRTPTEARLATLWSELFAEDDDPDRSGTIGVDDDFFDLGGHSIQAISLMARAAEIFDLVLPLHLISRHSTIASLAGAVDRLAAGGSELAETEASQIDWSRECELDPSVRPVRISETSREPGDILLTGATGFLGAFLLHEILTTTSAKIQSLVRAADDAGALERSIEALKHYGLWEESFRARLRATAGDLAKPLLGLAEANFHTLAGEVDRVFHVGAEVDVLRSYESLRLPNVLGTQEVVRLAGARRPKTLHFVSTWLPETLGPSAGLHVVDQGQARAHTEGQSGYTMSKWAAEQRVLRGQARGLAVRIYRPTRICGHSRSGVSNERDWLWSLLCTCIRLGAAPLSLRDWTDNMLPVDYVTRFLVDASSATPSKTLVELVNPRSTAFLDLVRWSASYGYSLAWVQVNRWESEVSRARAGEPISRPGWLWARSAEGARGVPPRTGNDAPPGNPPLPEIDEGLVHRYLAEFERRGLIPQRG